LLDLPLRLFLAAPELHPPQPRNQQLQAFDIGLTARQLFILGVQALALSPKLFRLYVNESLLGFRRERVEIRQGGVRGHHDRSMLGIL
jgi:hypothetical protein